MTFFKIFVICLGNISGIWSAVEINCQPGRYDGHQGCVPCEKNYYKNNTGPGPCTRCPSGLITNQTGSTSKWNCYQPCQEGQFIDTAFPCQPCPENTYRNASMDTCAICGDGFVNKRKGATSISECVPCPGGTYRYWALCRICEDDPTETCCKRSANEDFVSKKDCKDEECITVSSNYKWSDFCQPCKRNTYKKEGEIACKQCPNGTGTMDTGADSDSECQQISKQGQRGVESSISGTVSVERHSTLTFLFFVAGKIASVMFI